MSDRAEAYRQIALDLAGGQVGLHVSGYSMWPLLRPGDMVVAQPVPAETLRRGDLMVVRRAERDALITHRLVWVDAQGWHAKGDNCRQADAPVLAQMILGRVVVIERGSVQLDLTRPWWAWGNRWLGELGWREMRFAQWTGARGPVGGAVWVRLGAACFRSLIRVVLLLSLMADGIQRSRSG